MQLRSESINYTENTACFQHIKLLIQLSNHNLGKLKRSMIVCQFKKDINLDDFKTNNNIDCSVNLLLTVF